MPIYQACTWEMQHSMVQTRALVNQAMHEKTRQKRIYCREVYVQMHTCMYVMA